MPNQRCAIAVNSSDRHKNWKQWTVGRRRRPRFHNLLTVITGYSDLMLHRLAKDDANRSKVEEIRRAANRASSLTRQLLAFSRKQVLQPKVFD